MDDVQIKALQNKSLYPHEVATFEVIQTHISWVILTGSFAYKIKKPVNLGFCNFETLSMRQHFCDLEIQLNKRLAPDLYLDVIPITNSGGNLCLDGDGEVIDYAIKMHQFDQSRLLSNVHQEEGLSKALMISLAQQVASFHKQAAVVPDDKKYGTPEQIFEPMLDNFKVLNELEPSQGYANKTNDVATWAKDQCQQLSSILKSRKTKQFIKSAHGDMHLGNIVLIHGTPVIFDCIEFNDDFRFLDTINDMAFLAMDLDDKGYEDLSHFFCNRYFEATGDYQGALLLNFYKSYRAMVRAKVMGFTIVGTNASGHAKSNMQKELLHFIERALSYQVKGQPSLTITFGPSGSGKSHYTEELLIKDKSFRLRSDVIRKQLAGLDPYKHCPSHQKDEVYSDDMTQKVYQVLSDQASSLLKAGWPVIIDATCLKTWQRNLFMKLSQTLNIPFKILKFEQDAQILKSRLQRRDTIDKVSDANESVLEKQLNWLEPLTAEEHPFVDTISS